MVGVVAHQRRHVERRREPRLAVVEQVAEALVGLLRRPEARELPHRPQPPAVHARIHAARERELARQPDRRVGIRRQVRLRVQRPDRLPRERGERDVALGVLPLLSGHAVDSRARRRRRMRAMRAKPRSCACSSAVTPSPSGTLDVDPAADQRAHRGDVVRAAVAEHDRLVQRRPAEPVDVVAVDARLEQAPHDPREPALGGADQPGAVVGVLVVDARAVGERELQQPRVVADLAGRDQVRALLRDVLGVDVGALPRSAARAAATSLANAASIRRRSSAARVARRLRLRSAAARERQQHDGGERPHGRSR